MSRNLYIDKILKREPTKEQHLTFVISCHVCKTSPPNPIFLLYIQTSQFRSHSREKNPKFSDSKNGFSNNRSSGQNGYGLPGSVEPRRSRVPSLRLCGATSILWARSRPKPGPRLLPAPERLPLPCDHLRHRRVRNHRAHILHRLASSEATYARVPSRLSLGFRTQRNSVRVIGRLELHPLCPKP